LTGAPTGTPGSAADFGGASVVDEALLLSAGGTAAAVEFESVEGSGPFDASRGFSAEGLFASFFSEAACDFSSFLGLGGAGVSSAAGPTRTPACV
jgi:hypothetical protein